MTTPMIETVRNIPLFGEKEICDPIETDSGFPFDRSDRDSDFRSQLDDIAKRHPEFAEHLEGFPFRSETVGRHRPPRHEFGRFAERPFGSSRFDHFFDEEEPPTPKKTERSRKQNIQQSNTVDLGQKQEPVNDRSQRSMSAPPPDNRQRYVSSIHIPINKDGGMGDMGKAQSKPNERVIPIHVEGRDEPVIPKNINIGQTQKGEKIFGHSPTQFTQFVGKEKTPEPEVAPPPQPEPVQNTSIGLIQSIQKDVSELMSQVEQFNGVPKDKQYIYLDEMLTRNLLKLDDIDTQGQENIRQARKEAVKCIESCISILEAKAAANVQKPEEESPVAKESDVVVEEEPKTEEATVEQTSEN